MEIKYKKEFRIHWVYTDISGKLSLPGLGQLLINLAVEHAEMLGFGYRELRNKNLNWVLYRINIEIIRMPDWDEPVTLITWPVGVKGITGIREFILTDKKGNVLSNVNSEWFIIDLETRRPKRPEHIEGLVRYEHNEKAFTKTPLKANTKGLFTKLFSVDIRHSDLDLNGHATARRYFDWINDGAYHILKNKQIDMIQITFYNEAYLNDTMEIYIDDTKSTIKGAKSNDTKPSFIAVIKSKE
jgi:acyl-ACP thioesterase